MSHPHRLQNLAAKIETATKRLTIWSNETCDQPMPSQSNAGFRGGDPRNEFHSIRQFLLQQGIDTRVFSFGSVALPAGLNNGASITDDMGTIDNSFFFEFHRMLTPDRTEIPKVDVLVLIVRCFFQEEDNGSTTLHAQLVLNHDRDAVFDLNEEYDFLTDLADTDGWIQPYSEADGNRITFFEKSYTNMQEFKRFVLKLQKVLYDTYETFGNTLIPTVPVR